MTFFITALVGCLLALIISIIFLFKNYKKRESKKIIPFDYKEQKRKNENRSLIITFLGIAISVLGVILTLLYAIPTPTIYPLDNEAKVYDGVMEVYIDSYPLLTTYYTLDGNDPKDGVVYEDAFTITKTTTVSARNKFLFGGWSGISQRTYKFESIPISYSYSNVNDRIWISADQFLSFLFISFSLIIIIWKGLKSFFKNIKNRLRDFFDY